MGAIHEVVSDELWLLLQGYFQGDDQAIECEIRVFEALCASGNPNAAPPYTRLASELRVSKSTLYDRHTGFMGFVRSLVAEKGLSMERIIWGRSGETL